jgi:predicted transcriptional regulator
LLELTGNLVRAFLQRNNIPAAALPDLIQTTYDSLARLGEVSVTAAALPEAVGAVSLRKSLASPDHIISMIDGKPYRTLKKHLSGHKLTPQGYRILYKLPDDYPMVAPAYSSERSAMARCIGLGRKPGKLTPPAPPRRKLKIAGPKSV